MGLARVTIDATGVGKPLERVWASFGYDELNWTATPARQSQHVCA